MLQTDRGGKGREDELRMRIDVSPRGKFSMNASKRLTSELQEPVTLKTAYDSLIFGLETHETNQKDMFLLSFFLQYHL